MSLIWIDGFDSYGTSVGSQPSPSGILWKYYNVLQSDSSYSIANGRVSGYSLELDNYSNDCLSTKGIGNTSNYALVIGLAIKDEALRDNDFIFQAIDNLGNVQSSVYGNSDGTVSIRRGTSSTLGTSTSTIPVDDWYYLEWYIELGDSADTKLYINGTEEINLTSVDTKNSSAGSYNNYFILGSAGSSNSTFIDDMYIILVDGSGANSVLGPQIVETIRPNGDSGTNNWTVNTGSDHYVLVNEAVLNDDTYYLYTDTTDAIDLWDYTNPTSTVSTVNGVAIKTEAKHSTGGVAQIASYIDSNSSTQANTSKTISIGDYQALVDIVEEDPDTSTAWTPSGLVSAKFGVKFTS